MKQELNKWFFGFGKGPWLLLLSAYTGWTTSWFFRYFGQSPVGSVFSNQSFLFEGIGIFFIFFLGISYLADNKNAKENLNSETNFIICSFLFMLLIGLILFIIYPSILCGRKLIFLIHYLNT